MTENSSLAPTGPAGRGRVQRHLRLVGGLRVAGSQPLPPRVELYTLVGGAHLDLTAVQFESDDVAITVVSVVGGVDLTVRAGTRVDAAGVRLVGGVDTGRPPVADATGPHVRVRSYGVLGGVRVRYV